MSLPFTITRGMRDRMKASIAKVPVDAWAETPVDFFLLCRKAGKLEADTTLVSRGDDIDVPESCSTGGTPQGLFFVQPSLNTTGGPHVIARDMLRGLFVDGNFKIACSGYAQKVMDREPGVMKIRTEPKLLCVAPKTGATKARIKSTIKELDDVFSRVNGFDSHGYMKVVNKTFDTKRWNL